MNDLSPLSERLKSLAIPLVFLAIFALISCLMIFNLMRGFSSCHTLVMRQTISSAVGLTAAITLALLSKNIIRRFFWWAFACSYLLLWGLFLGGSKINGSQSWYFCGPFCCQPAEIFKVFYLGAIATLIPRLHRSYPGTWRFLAIISLFAAAMLVPIALQPDWGTVLIFALTTALLLWVDGLPLKAAIPLVLAGIAAFAAAALRYPHVMKRLSAFWGTVNTRTNASYHAERLQECLVKGGWTGDLFTNNDALNPLPYRYNDSFFAAAAEQLGAIGIFPIILLSFAWLVICIYCAYHQHNATKRLFMIGAGLLITIQSFLHLAVNLGLMPNTGLPMPILSYGGSSMISVMAIVILVARFNATEDK